LFYLQNLVAVVVTQKVRIERINTLESLESYHRKK
jgi:hypothetical protein